MKRALESKTHKFDIYDDELDAIRKLNNDSKEYSRIGRGSV